MPIEMSIWKVNDTITKLDYERIESEQKLEETLVEDFSIISDSLLVIGSQVKTTFNKRIDILAIDELGNLSIVELKRDKTPREVVAQAIDYASWVQDLTLEDIHHIYEKCFDRDLDSAFQEKFGYVLPEEVNVNHDILIVCTELDLETERIINYLSSNYGVPINAVFFKFFKDNGNEYLSRSWLIDPSIVEEKTSNSATEGKKEKWNGRDFIFNFQSDEDCRSWEDAVKYGFVSAGNGSWYTRTLKNLKAGHRIFVYMPSRGFLGVGIVRHEYQLMKNAQVHFDGKQQFLKDLELEASRMAHDINDEERCEYVVPVEWINTLTVSEAYQFKGVRANQNTVFKLRHQFTQEKLEERFDLM